MNKLFAIVLLFAVNFLSAQHAQVYPTNWWAGMKWHNVQLLIHGESSLADENVKITYPGISITKIHRLENPKYLAIDVSVSPIAKPGTVTIEFYKNGNKNSVKWPLKARRRGIGKAYGQGIYSSDFIYFLMPDRFSNGDAANDKLVGMLDESLNRDSIFYRHGGDLQGVINHLDYFQSLGVTALWLTPVFENNMPDRTEHGYAITNHYKVEPRFGGDTAYLRLSNELHKRGMKLIMDAVYNHMGLQHFLMQDPPMKSWVHQWPVFTKPNYKEQTHFDPYASEADKRKMADGWFTEQMPDLNQGNPYVANFLIQHALWCVEQFGVDGWRIDTYIYVDMPFMNRCNKALIDEYPQMTMVGESWVDATSNQAFFTRNNYNTAFKSNLPGTIDFQTLFHGIKPALTEPVNGVMQLYQTLSNDFLYKNPMANFIFLDNHDMSRFFSVVNEDVRKQKMGVQWLLTERGIPQMYYGTEVLMKGISNPDGLVRLDFPGGWEGDKKNAFTGTGLTGNEKSVQDLIKRLANFRKTSGALKAGKLMHFIPEEGLYIYFRYNSNQTIMCVMNTSESVKSIDFSRYAERTGGFKSAQNVITGETINISDKATVNGIEMLVLELKK
ncbi:MAG TPA: alpha-amylase family glycosyl hydrolase [Flavitalea sp.]|nr:alpha-amylase family glycosyl hydrolase [Flavitalea sp.]